MSKFVIACPVCHQYVQASTGLFASRRVRCACGNIIDVKTERLASRKCPSCGNQVVFDNSGDWTEINMKVGPVPANVVPANIKAHVSNNYSKYQIVQMMQNDKGYQVKLSNGTDLYYDKDGNILKTSD